MANTVDEFLDAFRKQAPLFYKSVARTESNHPELFRELGSVMLDWARNAIGDSWKEQLIKGYMTFVVDVNKCQNQYEVTGRYPSSSYSEVAARTYHNAGFMSRYHWGVYASLFAWEHHLLLYEFFKKQFLAEIVLVNDRPVALDLGCGSGIWSALLLNKSPAFRSDMVDISRTTVDLTRKFMQVAGFGGKVDVRCEDAMAFHGNTRYDAGMSCFLLEHLETPEKLLANLCNNLHLGAKAFISAALTAAESDHIFEFKRESEIILLCEEAGFRVLSTLSVAPDRGTLGERYLPRSMALILQKRHGDLW